jgi:lipoyl(octanoyl) transferase
MRPETWFHLDLGLMAYREVWDLQTRLVAERKHGVVDRNVILFVEHPPVFTLGRRGGRDNLKVSESFLGSRGIQVIPIERGGDITYHGPGQLVIYPILDLRGAGLGVTDFVHALEEVMIRTAADQGVTAGRNDLNRGVWVGMDKLGSIGIAVRHGITFHGLALNVNTDLEPFGWVHPCGLEDIRMTSMKRISGREIPMDEARSSAARHMEQVFGMTLEPLSLAELHRMPEKNP